MCRLFFATTFALSMTGSLNAGDKPLTLTEARDKVGKTVTVEFNFSVAPHQPEKDGSVYLVYQADPFKERELAIVITKAGVTDLKRVGIVDPLKFYFYCVSRLDRP